MGRYSGHAALAWKAARIRSGSQAARPAAAARPRRHALERRIGQARVAELVTAYQDDASCLEVSKRFGAPPSTVIDQLVRAGVPIRGPRRLSTDEVQRIQQPRTEGASRRAIALEVGASKAPVGKRVAKAALPKEECSEESGWVGAS